MALSASTYPNRWQNAKMTRFWSLFGQKKWANLASPAYAYKITIESISWVKVVWYMEILYAINATTTTFVVEQPEEIVKQS